MLNKKTKEELTFRIDRKKYFIYGLLTANVIILYFLFLRLHLYDQELK